jgi:hypothetical protein
MDNKGSKKVRLLDNNEVVHNRHSLKHKLVAAVANNDEGAARELRFLLKMEKTETMGRPKSDN